MEEEGWRYGPGTVVRIIDQDSRSYYKKLGLIVLVKPYYWGKKKAVYYGYMVLFKGGEEPRLYLESQLEEVTGNKSERFRSRV